MPGGIPPAPTRLANQGWHLPKRGLRRTQSGSAGPCPAESLRRRRALPTKVGIYPSVALRRTQSGSAGPCPAKSLRRRRALPTKVGIYPSGPPRRTQSGSAGPCPAKSLRRRRALPTKVGIYPSGPPRRTQSGSAGLCPAESLHPNGPSAALCTISTDIPAPTQGSHNVAGSSCRHGTAQPPFPSGSQARPWTCASGAVRSTGGRPGGRIPVLAGL